MVHTQSPEPATLRPAANLRQLGITLMSEAVTGGRPIRETCKWTRLAKVGAIAPSSRADVIALGPQAKGATAATAMSARHRLRPAA
jgi:hypothetical protein